MTKLSKVICNLIERFAPNELGVEIGVCQGYTSRDILNKTSTKHLFMIDPWMWNFDPTRGLYSKKKGHDPEKDFQSVAAYFAKNFSDQYTIIRKEAENAASDVPDDLGFIFIDGNHNHDYVMKDLTMWVPKVKSGGLVIGHDWWSKFPGVITAVTEYCKKHDIFLPPNSNDSDHMPAPYVDPVVMKSREEWHVWWAIKK